LQRLEISNPDARMHATGRWYREPDAERRTMALDFALEFSNAGHLLGRFGTPDALRGGEGTLEGKVSWRGAPVSIDYPSLAGSLRLVTAKGQFLKADAGAGRLLGVLSLQSLPRRITLDFRDVFSKGFGFDDIYAAARVESGVMTVKDFRMRGSSAQVQMSGEVDLAQETQNLRVRVIPSLGDSASLAIALVNPLLAIPAAIAQKILKDPLGHIFAFEYSVTGGWSDPKVAKLGIEARELQQQGSP